jgi:hypothetical protein
MKQKGRSVFTFLPLAFVVVLIGFGTISGAGHKEALRTKISRCGIAENSQHVEKLQSDPKDSIPTNTVGVFHGSKPWTRWWWFAAMIDTASIDDNLSWLKDNGFGGVEIAWVYPLNMRKKDTVNYTPRQKWLSPEWQAMVVFAKKCASELGLGCDFTFGSLWPFGDTQVPRDEATMNMKDTSWRQDITRTWEYPAKGYVIDHLNPEAFYHYGVRMGDALEPALKVAPSCIFCDSWEVETRYMSTTGFLEEFSAKYGYALEAYQDSLYSPNEPYRSVRYDYMLLLSDRVIESFYKPFTDIAHEYGAYSRVQCAGAPCDIINAYATADVPETEALLYEPAYSTIVASAAGLSGKNTVSCETFTCLYGWPANHHSEEQTADLKLVADAVFANGVNQIIWHGKPYNNVGMDTTKFYASVHVGKSGSLAGEIQDFNAYMEKVSSYMKLGSNYSDLAVYLPTEDSWIAGDLPLQKQFIWAWGAYEMRYVYMPQELKAYRPLWINQRFLQLAEYKNGLLAIGRQSFKALYVDVANIDQVALGRILELAKMGLPVCLKRIPEQAGFIKDTASFNELIRELRKCPSVVSSIDQVVSLSPLVTGAEALDYWCRKTDDGLYFFFANPKAVDLVFPLEYGQSLNSEKAVVPVKINYAGKTIPVKLNFEPYQSLLLKVDRNGKTSFIDITFHPKEPVFIPRVRNGKEKWEVVSPDGK